MASYTVCASDLLVWGYCKSWEEKKLKAVAAYGTAKTCRLSILGADQLGEGWRQELRDDGGENNDSDGWCKHWEAVNEFHHHIGFSGEQTLVSVWGNLLLTVAAFAPYLPPPSS